MAIEPITGTMMTAAVQTQQVKPAVVESKDANVPTQEAYVTATDAAVISKARNEGNSADNSAQDGENRKQPSERTIRQTVSDINKRLNNNTIAEFGYHEETNRVTIKIVDKETKEIIKELPPEKTLEMIAKAWELAGILVDERK